MTGRKDPDDAALWAEVARTVRPLKRRRPAMPATASETAAGKPAATGRKKPKGRLPKAVQPAPPPRAMPELAAGLAPGLDRRNALRLRRGELPIEGRVDLHGMTLEQAAGALRRFVLASRKAGRRCVLVITGKGGRGPGQEGGAIRRELPRWLNGGDLRPMVVAFTEAQPKDGGGGAFYVYLRRERAP